MVFCLPRVNASSQKCRVESFLSSEPLKCEAQQSKAYTMADQGDESRDAPVAGGKYIPPSLRRRMEEEATKERDRPPNSDRSSGASTGGGGGWGNRDSGSGGWGDRDAGRSGGGWGGDSEAEELLRRLLADVISLEIGGEGAVEAAVAAAGEEVTAEEAAATLEGAVVAARPTEMMQKSKACLRAAEMPQASTSMPMTISPLR